MKIAVITCYKYPDYGRAVALRSGLKANPKIQTIVIKNRYKGVLRYPEVLIKTFVIHLRQRPDVYLLTFRGYEMLPAILLIALRKPVILDELVNPLEVVAEHRQLYRGKMRGKLMGIWQNLGGLYSWLLRRCKIIIADTSIHAAYSAKISHVPIERFRAIPVGADEAIFKPIVSTQAKAEEFMVLYYGSMVPLHGLKYVIEAAEQLKDQPQISFLLVGGGDQTAGQVKAAQELGANVKYLTWIDPDKLPNFIADAGLCLGGPFGNTIQSQLVTTGKTYQFMASAAPVLIGETKETSANKLFVDKSNCLMVPQGSSKAIAEAIIWAQAHPAELKKISQSGNKLYGENFSARVISQKLASLMDEI